MTDECARCEELFEKKGELTDEELEFCLNHVDVCDGIHSRAEFEKAHGLAPGTLARWDGLPPLPTSA